MSTHSSNWPVSRVRSTFIEFFKGKPDSADGHAFVASSPCVPVDDPTLLFTNAGMNQFKPIFLGDVPPGSPLHGLKRAVNSQKCIRAGGKHNDLDDVGRDTYHHTFFEMLGNWSFGDYFKKEAVEWSWELLTNVYGLPKEALYATYFEGKPEAGLEPDIETRDLWLKFLPAERVIPGNMKDNFWEMGETGPCGPCTEIHVDRLTAMGIQKRSVPNLVNSGDPDVIEIWNNVFIQFNREDGGTLRTLPAKHVDTGMGLERLTSILQNVRSNYDTDVFFPIFAAIERTTGARPYAGKLGSADTGNVDTAYRVIADHIRTLTFAITDGATPGNDGRGYVLRRILRRAVRYGRQVLNAKPGFFAGLVPVVVEHFGEAFPELRKNPKRVVEIIRDEEESFGKTLERGLKLFDEAMSRAALELDASLEDQYRSAFNAFIGRSATSRDTQHRVNYASEVRDWSHFNGPRPSVSADDAFKLHDTYGFPIDLTMQMAEERGLKVDVAGYERLMEQARELARSGGKLPGEEGEATLALDAHAAARLEALRVNKTDDSDKFHGRMIKATVKAIWNGQNFDEHCRAGSQTRRIGVVLSKTNFYATMGGQETDTGLISVLRESRGGPGESGHAGSGGEFRVEEVLAFAGYVLHVGEVTRGELRVNDTVELHVDGSRRQAIMANHTATHLLNLALKGTLGEGVEQKGSLVAQDRLRFDFSHTKSTTPEELAKIESDVRQNIEKGLDVSIDLAPLDLARAINGVRAVFGETYPNPVRVVAIGAKVRDLLDDPSNAAWQSLSVEFCGGTHVANTRDIGAFVLAGEEAVAKGIRRITALTGVPAQAAARAADVLADRIAQAKMLRGAELASAATQLAQEVDTLTLPTVRRQELRQDLSALQERIKQESKALAGERAARAAAVAKRLAEDAASRGGQVVVASIDSEDGGNDRQALQQALNIITQACPRSAVMVLNADTAEGKVSLIAAVPKDLQAKGLKAGDWVRATSEVVGGKGGGKPDLAQGGGTNVGKFKDAMSEAQRFGLKAVGL
ncbi:MAG: alanine--tRNA ligase [Phycisphaeraceae bacterium]|nr:alanine--tRNA ligase [Phycisphaeraceae bacterium]